MLIRILIIELKQLLSQRKVNVNNTNNTKEDKKIDIFEKMNQLNKEAMQKNNPIRDSLQQKIVQRKKEQSIIIDKIKQEIEELQKGLNNKEEDFSSAINYAYKKNKNKNYTLINNSAIIVEEDYNKPKAPYVKDLYLQRQNEEKRLLKRICYLH